MTAAIDEATARALVDVVGRLDALVKLAPAERAGEAAEHDAAEWLARWRRVGAVPIVFSSTDVTMSGHPCGRPGAGLDARLHLCASAGLGRLLWRPGCTPADALWLTAAIARAEANSRSLAALRQWLWSDAVTGFSVDLVAPAAAALARSGAGAVERGAIDAARNDVVARLLATAGGAGAMTDAPPPIDREGALRLRLAADDGAFWLDAERTALDSDESLRERTYAAQHAAWLRRTLATGASLTIAGAMAGLHRDDGSWSQSLARELPPRVAGRICGRSVRLHADALAEIDELLVAGDAFAGGLASGLLERGRGDEASLKALDGIVRRFGLERLWEIASLDDIEAPAARSLAWVLRHHDAQPQLWADLVGWAPAEVSAWVLSSAPRALLARLVVPLRRGLRERGPAQSMALIEALLATDDAAAIGALGEVMLETGGKGWVGRIVPEVCAGLVRHGHGRRLVLPLFLDRNADVKLRSVCLRVMMDDAELLEEAVRFRVTEMMEPKELLERIKAARAALKEQRAHRRETR
jgi:hypothetical protein